ncbi:GATA transcription factor 4-like [Mercurialis annua]|uniref:GATA transcription factor 4-like n=1 Tax=Mercurialis annua TaxID=3986 RepID=UPI0021606F91|nr:GATA transcription factor 4-like [Mercurialis annua]
MDINCINSTTTAPDTYFPVDDLLDFSNDDLSASNSTSTSSPAADHQHHLPPPLNPSSFSAPFNHSLANDDFTNHLFIPSDDAAELEWLSRFVDDSFIDFPSNSLTGTINLRSDTPFSGKARSKRSRAIGAGTATAITMTWSSSLPETATSKSKKGTSNRSSSPITDGGIRRCSHCASEKTPQWRTGPLGPKTLCNACGVRYKSGRLVPEYRPAASPTFVLTQHSNSHRKVLELRRQKEMFVQQQEDPRIYHRHHPQQHDFEVC